MTARSYRHRAVQRRHPRRLRLRRRHQQVSHPITRAFHQLLRLSTAWVLFGLAPATARSCAMGLAPPALVLKFFTAIASCTCMARIHNGTGGAMGGPPQDLLILVAARRRHRLRSRRITRAFHHLLRLSTASVLSGLVPAAERSCATAPAHPATVLKSFTAIASCMR